MAVNIATVNKIRRACEAVRDLVSEARPRGPLADLPNKRRGHVSRTGKWLLRAIGEMIHDDKRLVGLLGEFAMEPPISDEALDRLVEANQE